MEVMRPQIFSMDGFLGVWLQALGGQRLSVFRVKKARRNWKRCLAVMAGGGKAAICQQAQRAYFCTSVARTVSARAWMAVRICSSEAVT